MVQILDTLLRILPWLMTTVTANLIHYRSLLCARKEAHRQFLETAASTNRRHFPGSPPDEHELLTFDLMQSPTMRRARYKIKLVHYGGTVLYIVLFYHLLPELNYEKFAAGLGTVEGLVVGLLSGLITILLNENKLEDIRTKWRPGVDYESRLWGLLWDVTRILGAMTTPIEDGLFYHSWMYRVLVQYLHDHSETGSFINVSFSHWSWKAWLTCNSAFAIYNGKEWRSSLLSGLFSLWAIGRNGQFIDGIIVFVICRMTVNCWVVLTGQRQFW